MQAEQIAFSTGELACAPWPRMCGEEEVAFVIGLKKAEGGADPKGNRARVRRNFGSRLFPLTEQEEPAWRQQIVRLYDALGTSLYRYLRNLGLPPETAEDVLQESFLRLARHLKNGGPEDNLRSWLFQVAHHLSMDIHRKSNRGHNEPWGRQEIQEEPEDPSANPEWAYLEKEKIRNLKAAMSRLTTQQYNCMILRAQGLRYREIAEILGISEQRAVHLVKRGTEKLQGGM